VVSFCLVIVSWVFFLFKSKFSSPLSAAPFSLVISHRTGLPSSFVFLSRCARFAFSDPQRPSIIHRVTLLNSHNQYKYQRLSQESEFQANHCQPCLVVQHQLPCAFTPVQPLHETSSSLRFPRSLNKYFTLPYQTGRYPLKNMAGPTVGHTAAPHRSLPRKKAVHRAHSLKGAH